jgi:hypothetical protein
MLTKRHLRKEVVYNVVVSNIVEKEPSLPSEEVAVDCTSGTALEIPLSLAVVRELRVGVMQIRDHNEL